MFGIEYKLNSIAVTIDGRCVGLGRSGWIHPAAVDRSWKTNSGKKIRTLRATRSQLTSLRKTGQILLVYRARKQPGFLYKQASSVQFGSMVCPLIMVIWATLVCRLSDRGYWENLINSILVLRFFNKSETWWILVTELISGSIRPMIYSRSFHRGISNSYYITKNRIFKHCEYLLYFTVRACF